MKKEVLKKRLCEAIENRKDEIISIGRKILENPELGYGEKKTTALVKERFENMGLEYVDGVALTGVKAKIKGRSDNPTIGVFGELDAIVVPDHPFADLETGAAHACGHNAQVANLLGVAVGLIDSGVMGDLEGSVALIGAPAEEFIDIEGRKKLMDLGKIGFPGGKQELIRKGWLDDVNLAMMIHASPNTPQRRVMVRISMSCFLAKLVKYGGKRSHAGAAPEKGVNALNAAMLGLQAIHVQRETFRDEDVIRVHPIIIKGGEAVNVVPADVRIETFVRARSMEALMDANRKVDRALKSGAMAIGCDIEIDNIPGYMPLNINEIMAELFADNAAELIEAKSVYRDRRHSAASSDMGDVTQIMPGIHPFVGGFDGVIHTKSFRVIDEEMAYVIPAKIMAMTIVDLLSDGAKMAKRALEEKVMTKDEYFEKIGKLSSTVRENYL